MKKLLQFACLLWVTFLCHSLPGQNYRRAEIPLDSIASFQLENGLQVAVVENPDLPTICLKLFLNPDSVSLTSDAGLVRSYLRQTARDSFWQESLNQLGINMVSATESLTFEGFANRKDTLFGLLGHCVSGVVFRPLLIDSLAEINRQERAFELPTPAGIANQVGHRLIAGPLAPDSTRMDSIHCTQYYRRAYGPEGSLLVVVGNVRADSLRKTIAAKLATWKRTGAPLSADMDSLSPATLPGRKVFLVHREEVSDPYLKILFPFANYDSIPREHQLELLSLFLGGHPQSKLNQNLRVKHGFSYGVISNVEHGYPFGYLTVQGGVGSTGVDSAIWQIFYEVDQLRQTTINDRQLRFGKKMLETRFTNRVGQPVQIADLVGRQLRSAWTGGYYAHYRDSIRQTRASQLLQTASSFLDPGHAQVILVGNREVISPGVRLIAADSTIRYLDTEGGLLDYGKLVVIPDMTPEKVIAKYLDTVNVDGGLDSLRSMEAKWQASFSSSSLEMTFKAKRPQQLLMEISTDGILVNSTKLNGDTIQLQDRIILSDSLYREQLRTQAAIIPEVLYENVDYKLELAGAEFIEGERAHSIKIDFAGETWTEYYAVDSGLKVASYREIAWQGERKILKQFFGDYREVKGLLLPHETRLEGLFPWPVTFKLETIALNGLLSDAVFQIK